MPGTTDSFFRPVSYWIERAQLNKQRGQFLRAAKIERHAKYCAPGNTTVMTYYALTLRDMHCYEASNRELFNAILTEPSKGELFGLIGMNLLDLGKHSQAMDAFSLYEQAMCKSHRPPPIWDEDARDLHELYDFEYNSECLEGTLDEAESALENGDTDKAQALLERSEKSLQSAENARRDVLYARLHIALNDHADVEALLAHALETEPQSAAIALQVARILRTQDQKDRSIQLIERAALYAHTPDDEREVCALCEEIDRHDLAYAMLKRSLKEHPYRVPVCFNMAVAYLKKGDFKRAMALLDRCYAADPDDVICEGLYLRMRNLIQTDEASVQIFAQQACYYGLEEPYHMSLVIAPVLKLLMQGSDVFANEVANSRDMRRRFFYMVSNNPDYNTRLLSVAAAHTSKDSAERMLREYLLLEDRNLPIKQVAVSLLCELNAEPPYLLREKDCLFAYDPEYEDDLEAAFQQRIFRKRFQQAADIAGDDIIPWCMLVLERLSNEQRKQLLSDEAHVWPAAMASYYCSFVARRSVILPRDVIDDQERSHALVDIMAELEKEFRE